MPEQIRAGLCKRGEVLRLHSSADRKCPQVRSLDPLPLLQARMHEAGKSRPFGSDAKENQAVRVQAGGLRGD
jgi:hypothetical protein